MDDPSKPRNGVSFQSFVYRWQYGTAVGDGGVILRTTNGGDSWSPQTSGTTKTLYGVSFTDTNNGTISGFALGGTGIILRTTDGGNNWVEQTNYSLPQGASAFYAVSFTAADTGTIVGDAGIVLQTPDGGTQWYGHSAATTGCNRRLIQPTGSMLYTSAMKITAQLSDSSKEKFSPQPMVDKIGLLKQARQQACWEFILLIRIPGRLLATMV